MTVWISTLHRRASRHRHTTPLLRSSEPTVSVCESASAAYHARVITSKKAPLKMDPSNRGRQSEQTAALGCVSHVPSCACAWGRGGSIFRDKSHTNSHTEAWETAADSRRRLCSGVAIIRVHKNQHMYPNSMQTGLLSPQIISKNIQ